MIQAQTLHEQSVQQNYIMTAVGSHPANCGQMIKLDAGECMRNGAFQPVRRLPERDAPSLRREWRCIQMEKGVDAAASETGLPTGAREEGHGPSLIDHVVGARKKRSGANHPVDVRP